MSDHQLLSQATRLHDVPFPLVQDRARCINRVLNHALCAVAIIDYAGWY
jgi:hypothetical protein